MGAGLLMVLMAADMSPVLESDVYRFPFTPAQTQHGYEFGFAHVQWLSSHGYLGSEWLAEASYCFRCWDLLDDVRRHHPTNAAMNRVKLATLRELLGERDFMLGIMPDPAPFHRFCDRDRDR